MSTAHFSRQFRAAYGETPYAYLMTRRIERAKALLRRGDLSVTEVCLEVGCTSLGSFSARFTQLVGETPTAYRARDHSALASVPGCIAKDLTRPSRKASRIEEAPGAGRPRVARMNLTLSTCFVLVHDPDLALAFYRDTLGLELRNDVARERLPLDHRRRRLPARRRDRPHELPERQPRRRRRARRPRRQGRPERRPLPHRRPRRDVRQAARRGRRDRAGADRPAVGHARLRRPRPVRQPRADRPAAGRAGHNAHTAPPVRPGLSQPSMSPCRMGSRTMTQINLAPVHTTPRGRHHDQGENPEPRDDRPGRARRLPEPGDTREARRDPGGDARDGDAAGQPDQRLQRVRRHPHPRTRAHGREQTSASTSSPPGARLPTSATPSVRRWR